MGVGVSRLFIFLLMYITWPFLLNSTSTVLWATPSCYHCNYPKFTAPQHFPWWHVFHATHVCNLTCWGTGNTGWGYVRLGQMKKGEKGGEDGRCLSFSRLLSLLVAVGALSTRPLIRCNWTRHGWGRGITPDSERVNEADEWQVQWHRNVCRYFKVSWCTAEKEFCQNILTLNRC